MTGRGLLVFLAWVVGIVAIAVAGYFLRYPIKTYRYRMTVEVETPQGLRTGSAVREVKFQDGPNIGGGLSFAGMNYRGEAVAVDLPGGRTLFMLVEKNPSIDIEAAFRDAGVDPGARTADILARARRTGQVYLHPSPAEFGVGELRSRSFPQLVTFGDINDPKSVVAVDPIDLAASFGPGVGLRRITAQITSEPVTTGIEKRLVWLPKTVGAFLKRPVDANIGDMPLAGITTEGDFSQGILS